MKKVLSIVLAALLLCTMFAGCQKKEETAPVEEEVKSADVVDGNVPEEIYCGAVVYNSMQFMSMGLQFPDSLDMDIGGMTAREYLRDSSIGLIKEFEACKAAAKEKGIEPTEEERKAADEELNAMLEEQGGREAFMSELEHNGITEEFFNYLNEGELYFRKISELFTEGGELAPDTSNALETIKTNYPVRVKHVLVMAEDGAEDFAEKKALAEEIATRAAAGEDFEALITEYGEDPGMTQNPDGYLFSNEGKTPDGGTMATEFAEASVALAEGGVSAPVKTTYGFHIIKRYPMDDAVAMVYAETEKNNLIANAYSEFLTPYAEKIVISNEEELKAIDLATVFPSHEGHDHETGIEEGSVELAPADGEAEAPAVEVVPADGGIEQGTAVPAAQ